jgi:hypothetical protein
MIMLIALVSGCGGGGGSSSSSNTSSGDTSTTATPTPTPAAGFFAVPTIADVAPNAQLVFVAENASGSAHFAVSTNNSGATITSSGVYTAGNQVHVSDVVTVSDDGGNSANVPVFVGPAVFLVPPAAVVTANSSTTLGATGGSGTGYQFFDYANASAGAVTNNVYQAGPGTSKIDVVLVEDSNGTANFGLFAVSPTIGITVPGSTFTAAPGGTVQLAGTGGSGSYRWFLAGNLSGGSINEATGLYTAGSTGGVTDVILASDTSSPANFTVGTITVSANAAR